MNEFTGDTVSAPFDSGLAALCAIANYYRLPADPEHLERALNLRGRHSTPAELLRLARKLGLKGRLVATPTGSALERVPTPALATMRDGACAIYLGMTRERLYRLFDPVLRQRHDLPHGEIEAALGTHLMVLQRHSGAASEGAAAVGFAWFLASIWRYRRPLSHVLIASLLIQLFAIISPFLFQAVMDQVVQHQASATLLVITVALVATVAFDVLLTFLRSYALAHTANRIDVELGQRLFAHLLSLPLSYFETRPAGQTAARLRELETIRGFLTGQALFSVLDVVFATASIAVMFLYSTILAVIVTSMVPVYLLIGGIFTPLLRRRMQERFMRGAQSQQFLLESISGILTLKSAAVEADTRLQWEERLAAYVRTGFRATLLATAGQSAVQVVTRLSSVAVLFVGVRETIEGRLTIGQLVAFNMIAAQVVQPLLRLSQVWQEFQQARISVERLNDILTTPPEPAGATSAPAGRPLGAIEFCGVSFRYQAGMPFVLRDLSLQIAAGEVVGIVGPSGSGKSSIARLIQRLHLPTTGRVLIDGQDVAQLDPAWIRTGIAVVFQEPLLFHRTVRENISLSNPSLSRHAVVRAARLAGADEFIMRLPLAYDTMIEERGGNLSGGQRQRIAIARALASDPSVLILDEATSELDFEGERLVRGNLRKIAEGRTVIIIAHRLSMVRNCDRIFTIADGRLIETGTHAQLLDVEDGVYARLWRLQYEDGAGARR